LKGLSFKGLLMFHPLNFKQRSVQPFNFSKNYSLFTISYSLFWAFPFGCAQPNPQQTEFETRRLPKGRSPAHTPRWSTKHPIRHIGAPKVALSAGGLLSLPAVGYLAFELTRTKPSVL